ncbi:MAG: HAD-IA family hydrolase [Treponema sp.]|jgi:putative hydrolase of the HAD superfamily|nr:HAD-IA family hydrolase [Treponema sp.]
MIQYLLFDLDNTLYSSRYGLEQNVSRRITDFTAGFLGLSTEETVKLRARRIPFYGTTLEWLMAEEGLTDADHYFRIIHPEDEAEILPPDPALGEFLEGIKLPKAVLTNSPMEHAERVLARLGIRSCFGPVFDIRWNNFKGKPRPDVYRRVLECLNSSPETTLFIDDYPKYITGYLALGGKGLLFDENNEHPAHQGPRIRELREVSLHLD